MGPMTGRQAGLCAGYNTPGFLNRGFGLFGRGRGGGGGGGRGRRNWFYATGLTGWQRAAMGAAAPTAATAATTADVEKQYLEAQIGTMQSQIEALTKRLADIEAQK
ncbi:MAG: DUF5320 domain-containing protein [Pirellulales bacterium]|nr:DUF5320 domain-containing protein [Pirellulales bacterium]